MLTVGNSLKYFNFEQLYTRTQRKRESGKKKRANHLEYGFRWKMLIFYLLFVSNIFYRSIERYFITEQSIKTILIEQTFAFIF